MEALGVQPAGHGGKAGLITCGDSPVGFASIKPDGGAGLSPPARRLMVPKNAGLGRLSPLRLCAEGRLIFRPRKASNRKCQTPLREYSYGSS